MEEINNLIWYSHGSQDSLDRDIYYVFNELPNSKACQEFCYSETEEDRNIIIIQEGIVTNCFNGTIDEINNGLLITYFLQNQAYPLLVNRTVPRDVGLKIIRVIRCIISYCSRTHLRPKIKQALKSNLWLEKIKVLEKISFLEIDNFNKSQSKIDIYKVIAFQLGQVMGLIQKEELYTKQSISKKFPSLQPYIYREALSYDALQAFYIYFLTYLKSIEVKQIHNNIFLSEYGLYDLKEEQKLD